MHTFFEVVMKKFTYIVSALLIGLTLCACASSEAVERQPDYTSDAESIPLTPEQEETPVVTASSTAEVTIAEATTSALPRDTAEAPDPAEQTPLSAETAETTEPPEELDTFYSDSFAAYSLTPQERSFTKDSIFVGDSICRGFSVYKTVHKENVFARGSLAARSLFDYELYYGDEELTYVEVLHRTDPKFVFLSMGMNDVNITDEETFCENYKAIIDTTLENSSAAVYVCAITPVNNSFTSNYVINCFNLAIRDYIEENYPERVYYVDFAKHLKDEAGRLRECFDGGDGIHLSPYAYYVALWEMNRTTVADGLR